MSDRGDSKNSAGLSDRKRDEKPLLLKSNMFPLKWLPGKLEEVTALESSCQFDNSPAFIQSLPMFPSGIISIISTYVGVPFRFKAYENIYVNNTNEEIL